MSDIAILKSGAKERDNYLSVSEAGGSACAVEILKQAGFDMTTPVLYRAVVALIA